MGRGAFSVIRQLLYFSDKCVFLLAEVIYYSPRVRLWFLVELDSLALLWRTLMISSLLNACVTPCFCSLIVKTWLAFLYMRSLCHGLEPCLPMTEAKAYFRHYLVMPG